MISFIFNQPELFLLLYFTYQTSFTCIINVLLIKLALLFLSQHLLVKLQEKEKEIIQLATLLDTEKVL